MARRKARTVLHGSARGNCSPGWQGMLDSEVALHRVGGACQLRITGVARRRAGAELSARHLAQAPQTASASQVPIDPPESAQLQAQRTSRVALANQPGREAVGD